MAQAANIRVPTRFKRQLLVALAVGLASAPPSRHAIKTSQRGNWLNRAVEPAGAQEFHQTMGLG
jgi:hypothetical protein